MRNCVVNIDTKKQPTRPRNNTHIKALTFFGVLTTASDCYQHFHQNFSGLGTPARTFVSSEISDHLQFHQSPDQVIGGNDALTSLPGSGREGVVGHMSVGLYINSYPTPMVLRQFESKVKVWRRDSVCVLCVCVCVSVSE